MTIKWGILGTGGIAREFAQDVSTYTEMEIAAVGSRTLEKAEQFELATQAFGSYEELVNSDVDAIYIATPHQLHCENTILALTAGKPVLCEKPFAVSANEAKAMADKAKNKNLLLMEAMWTRYLPHIQKLREILSEIGDIYSVSADHGQALTHIKRLTDPNYAGGALLDLGIYPVSFIHMVLGKPKRITSRAEIVGGVDYQTSAIFEYESGAHGTFTTNLKVKGPTIATISGTKARLELQTSFYRPTNMRLIYNDGTIKDFPSNYRGHGLREQAIYFEKLLIGGKKDSPLLSINETISIMESLDEIRAQVGLKYPFE